MEIEGLKQLDQCLLDEINVKKLIRDFGMRDENGKEILLCYDGVTRLYCWNIGERVVAASDKLVLLILK